MLLSHVLHAIGGQLNHLLWDVLGLFTANFTPDTWIKRSTESKTCRCTLYPRPYFCMSVCNQPVPCQWFYITQVMKLITPWANTISVLVQTQKPLFSFLLSFSTLTFDVSLFVPHLSPQTEICWPPPASCSFIWSTWLMYLPCSLNRVRGIIKSIQS